LATKQERLLEFIRRLEAASPVATGEDALELLSSVLNAVEDEMTDIPYDPANWQTDGRMYPPQADSARVVSGLPNVTRYRNRHHNTYIATNGAIEIEVVSNRTPSQVILSKVGRDGCSVPKPDPTEAGGHEQE